MQSKRVLLVGLVIALCITPFFFLLSDTRAPETSTPAIENASRTGTPEGLANEEKPAEAKLAVASTSPHSHTFIAETAGTLESVMQERREDGSLIYTSKLYPTLGSFVESIGGLKNAGGSYWMLYINGSLSSSGMSQAMVKRGDRIEWRYE